MTAEKLINTLVEEWGEREVYPVTEEEFVTLFSSGARSNALNRPNGDGTFYSELELANKKFAISTSIEIALPATLT